MTPSMSDLPDTQDTTSVCGPEPPSGTWVSLPSTVLLPLVETLVAAPPSTAQENTPPKLACVHMMSAESPTRLKVMDWPAAESCTNFAFGPSVCPMPALPASAVGQVNDVSPELTDPINPRPPPER